MGACAEHIARGGRRVFRHLAFLPVTIGVLVLENPLATGVSAPREVGGAVHHRPDAVGKKLVNVLLAVQQHRQPMQRNAVSAVVARAPQDADTFLELDRQVSAQAFEAECVSAAHLKAKLAFWFVAFVRLVFARWEISSRHCSDRISANCAR